MRKIELETKPIDAKELNQRTALETDATKTIEEPCIITRNGEPIIIYGRFQEPNDEVRWACKKIDYQKSTRTNGLKTESRIFGFKPRVVIRADYCSTASLAETHPAHHAAICQFGKRMAEIYQAYAPECYARHQALLERIKPDWVIPGTPFTSGIVNNSNPLKYHYDSGNFEKVMSCMVVFRESIEGGNLVIPELDVKFKLQDNSFFLFDGQSILHGVTAMKKKNAKGYRYSLVYYALEAMRHCGCMREELARIRLVKKQRENKRLLGLFNEG